MIIEYICNVLSNMFSIIPISFLIVVLGFLVGRITVKGVSLGTAGVLIVALLYGVIASKHPQLQIGNNVVILFNNELKEKYSVISSLGAAIFITAIGYRAGPKFFRSLNKNTVSYILIGIITIIMGSLLTIVLIKINPELSSSMASGIMTGALSSTSGLLAAKEIVSADADQITAGYGIAYLFGVLGVVLFVQVLPKLLKVDMDKERANFLSSNEADVPKLEKNVKKIDKNGLFPFFLAIVFGCLLGSMYIPGINFSLGTSGGCLISSLIFGHFGHIGIIDLRVDKEIAKLFREFGLVLFLLGSGVPGGVNFASNIKISYFIYGVIITIIPMTISYLIATKIFKMPLLNALGSVTGGMTSTPALGALISAAGIEDVANIYACTYPVAMICIVFAVKIILIIM